MANINKNIIMQAGTAVANATNKAAGLSASTPEPGAIISAIQLVNGGRTIGPDALAHFTESVRNKLLSLLVSLEPIQDFNGYGHPWPAGGGKNLLDSDSFVQGTINAQNGEDQASTNRVRSPFIYVREGEYTVSSGNGFKVVFDVYDENKVFIPSESYTTWYDTPNTFNVNGTRYVRILFSKEDNTTVTPSELTSEQLELGSSATSWEPYENICSISGRTGATAYVSPTPNVADATTYSADWTTPAGTVYAGSADIVTGDIKAAPYYASYNGETLVGPWVSSMDVYNPEGTPTTGAQVVDLGGIMTEYHITGQDIITLVGDNYIWSDSGDVTITE